MRLYLVQHAEAKSAEVDPSRGLMPKGIQDITKVAEFLSKAHFVVNEIFHSGKTRARETSAILADHIIVKHGVFDTDGLSPNDDPYIWADRLPNLSEDTMLVGHLPNLAKLATRLLCDDLKNPVVTFRNAGIVCLARSGEKVWTLEWMVIPDIIR